MRGFLILVIAVVTVWVSVSQGIVDSFWFLVVIGLLCFIGYALYDGISAIFHWLDRRREFFVIEQQHDRDIVDAEIISESDGKWWR
jgi:hypothetical protein